MKSWLREIPGSQLFIAKFSSGLHLYGAFIGYYIPDVLVDDRVIVEIKALTYLDNSHVAQVIGYLAVPGCPVGLLLNFGERSLRDRRILPPRNILEHRVNRQWLCVPNASKQR